MEPIVLPLLTVVEKNGKSFVSAEIPGVDLSDRPVFYKETREGYMEELKLINWGKCNQIQEIQY